MFDAIDVRLVELAVRSRRIGSARNQGAVRTCRVQRCCPHRCSDLRMSAELNGLAVAAMSIVSSSSAATGEQDEREQTHDTRDLCMKASDRHKV